RVACLSGAEPLPRDEWKGSHRRCFRPSHAVLIVAGDAPPAEIEAAAERAFGSWRDPAHERAHDVGAMAALGDPAPALSRLLLVDRPGSAQSELRIGHVGVSRRTPDYH